ncbi:uncharacterized protein LOC123663613 [Melitaea cinxia]|uniref:uncharacterized protein LOC123663613 n=1 Tax=Melitaea cinxia TaxID=113334 RepID=UPI001E26EC67|nr:uncharacterized protein LOC123663613 [Melitaea cinxia]
MTPFYFVLVLLIQNSYSETVAKTEDNSSETREILKVKPVSDDFQKGTEPSSIDWMDMFLGSNSNIFPTSSSTKMAQVALSNKSAEEQLEDIKNMAEQITKCIQSEMANLLSYAISITNVNNEQEDNKLRKKRSLDTPMDSTQLVMRLLKHIKSNNEYQNIAIEKMMSAQEIADKFGIEFNPDPEILSELALVTNVQAKEMSDILKDAYDLKNVTKRNESARFIDNEKDDAIQNLVDRADKNEPIKLATSFDYPINKASENKSYKEPSSGNDNTFLRYNYYDNSPFESQIPAPPSHHHHKEPVSSRLNFYDYISFNPNQEYLPYCSVEPMSIIYSVDEPESSELPELVGEEYEETISSKIYIDHEEEPGMASVNHVMTYTVSEKSHFRTPEVESLPQQMQYYFLLM